MALAPGARVVAASLMPESDCRLCVAALAQTLCHGPCGCLLALTTAYQMDSLVCEENWSVMRE